jgi:hypothetical protein
VCRVDPGVALPAHARSRVARVRWHTHVRLVALSSATPCLAHPSQQHMDKLLRRHLHANPLPLSALLHTRACALTLSKHGRALAATVSHPVGPGAHSYKRRPPSCILSVPLASPSAGKGVTASAPVSASGPPSPYLASLPLSSSACLGAPTHFREAP